jgi:hypothetical protein
VEASINSRRSAKAVVNLLAELSVKHRPNTNITLYTIELGLIIVYGCLVKGYSLDVELSIANAEHAVKVYAVIVVLTGA